MLVNAVNARRLNAIHRYTQKLALPGRVRSIGYETARGTRWLYHVLDAEAMCAWLEHPDFHLVK